MATSYDESLFLKKSVYDLKFHDLTTKVDFSYNPTQEDLFSFWKRSWETSFSDLGYTEKQTLYSDDFFNQRILYFTEDEKPVGCIFLESFNLQYTSHRESRYLKNYPQDMINGLVKSGYKKAYALSNLTVCPTWRKSKTNLPISQLLTAMGIWKACQEEGHVLLSCVRNDRKVNTLFQNHNSKTYSTQKRYNCAVDFIYIDLKDAAIFPDHNIMKACLYFMSGHRLTSNYEETQSNSLNLN